MNHLKEAFEAIFQNTIDSLYNTSQSDELLSACHYALMGAGKRTRPLLVLSCNQLLDGHLEDALYPAAAVEMIHTYSLTHDDLPLMDNDDMRRGRPSVHKVFGDVTALLAGDALLTDAFSILSKRLNPQSTLSDSRRLQMVSELALSCGGCGMVLGQSRDMQSDENRISSPEALEEMHSLKTGRLLAASCTIGALSATKSSTGDLLRLRQFGEKLGLAFQILDDLLDNKTGTGKSVGKDKIQGKFTFLSCWSEDKARERAEQLSEEAKKLLQPYGSRAQKLCQFIDELHSRTH
ncbi:MAG: polyprenyl synthetase family protein [Oligoflexales bacterium]|nr:polyprenyl synthetase family protein [Oligoflexales bacterium]